MDYQNWSLGKLKTELHNFVGIENFVYTNLKSYICPETTRYYLSIFMQTTVLIETFEH